MPVHVLPKLEYQLCYGMECLTKSEICQLWAETLLHSSNVSYIGESCPFAPLQYCLFYTVENYPSAHLDQAYLSFPVLKMDAD